MLKLKTFFYTILISYPCWDDSVEFPDELYIDRN